VIHVAPRLLVELEAGDKPAVHAALQHAIELEHATMPPYLYALYSLVPGRNRGIADIIESVVVEEMLHLVLAANVLNALGGAPVLDDPAVVPTYPGPLPGTVESDVVVGLAPFSIDLVGHVFMAIEEPEHPLEFPAAVAGPQPLTIGAFYRRIREKVVALGDSAFSAEPRNQISSRLVRRAVEVTDVRSACGAIDTIVDQGEGTATDPLEVVGDDYAHYYRFAEIFHGRRLIPRPVAPPHAPPDERYVYGGDPVPFDPGGVLAAPTNPKASDHPAGSAAREVCDTFNDTYTDLLGVLHATLNGEPSGFYSAIGLMMSLKQQAKDMMSGTVAAGATVGPTFEYQPADP
jgi:hypothetical protein